jgi:mannose-6-phosphate isomerase
VLSTDDPEGFVYLGFSKQIDDETVDRWFSEQQSDVILAAMNRIPVRAGDAVLVPAGMPHAIGPGIFLIELQEPTDFSVMLEWQPFGLDAARDTQLGMDARSALECMDTSAWPADEVVSRFVRAGVVHAGGSAEILPPDAKDFFRAVHVDSTAAASGAGAAAAELPAGYSILVVINGSGSISTGGVELPVSAGSTVLIPHGAGPVGLHGDFYGVRCLPPAATPPSGFGE